MTDDEPVRPVTATTRAGWFAAAVALFCSIVWLSTDRASNPFSYLVGTVAGAAWCVTLTSLGLGLYTADKESSRRERERRKS